VNYKAVFPTDDDLFKSIYLAMTDITKKWTGTSWNWGADSGPVDEIFRRPNITGLFGISTDTNNNKAGNNICIVLLE